MFPENIWMCIMTSVVSNSCMTSFKCAHETTPLIIQTWESRDNCSPRKNKCRKLVSTAASVCNCALCFCQLFLLIKHTYMSHHKRVSTESFLRWCEKSFTPSPGYTTLLFIYKERLVIPRWSIFPPAPRANITKLNIFGLIIIIHLFARGSHNSNYWYPERSNEHTHGTEGICFR